ncbi:MAG: acyltransferase family protein [Undibacterium sp.]|nr:acyltransferase family protein [Undibacterium sp.]
MSNTSQITRSDFLDRIRVILTILVILHHTAIMYGADGGWYLRYKASGLFSGVLLTLFCAVNQSFFMGAFFMLAGYFTPRSFDGKGIQKFVMDRLLRLGVPILVFGFLLGPLSIAMLEIPADMTMFSFWWYLIQKATFNIGPLWFAYALLIFSGVYVLLRSLLGRTSWEIPASKLRHPMIVLALLVWGIGAFLLRLWVPTGKEFALLQIGYFSSYIVLFFIGCAAAKHRLLEKIEAKLALPWAWISLLTIPTLFIYAALAGAFKGAPFELHGGWTLPVVFYAFWEPLVACGIILLLLWRCRMSQNPWNFWSRLAPLTYAAFIIHTPIVVAFGVLSKPWQQYSLPMFAVVGALSLAASFGIAAILVKLPGARRIL